jgi:hypothetical protein
LGGFG